MLAPKQQPKNEPVNRDAMRILVADVGYNLAAKETGISHWTIRKWAQRGHWFNKRPLHETQKSLVQNVQKRPIDAYNAILQEKRANTTAHMATYAERAAKQAATHREPLRISRNARDVEAIRASLWPHENTQNVLNVQVLNQVNVTRSKQSEATSENDVSA